MTFSNLAILVIIGMYNGLEKQIVQSLKTIHPDISICTENIDIDKKIISDLQSIENVTDVYAVWEEIGIIKNNFSSFSLTLKHIEPYNLFIKKHLNDFLLTKNNYNLNGSSLGAELITLLRCGISPKNLYAISLKNDSSNSQVEIKKIPISNIYSIDEKIDSTYIFMPYDFSNLESQKLKCQKLYLYTSSNKNLNRIILDIKNKLKNPLLQISCFSDLNLPELKMIKIEKKSVNIALYIVLFISSLTLIFCSKVILLLKKKDFFILNAYGFSNTKIKKLLALINFYSMIFSIALSCLLSFAFLIIQNKYSIITLGVDLDPSTKLNISYELSEYLFINTVSAIIMFFSSNLLFFTKR